MQPRHPSRRQRALVAGLATAALFGLGGASSPALAQDQLTALSPTCDGSTKAPADLLTTADRWWQDPPAMSQQLLPPPPPPDDGCNIHCPVSTTCRSWSLNLDDCICVAHNKPRGTLCNDGNACTTGDACNGSGSCVGVFTGCPITWRIDAPNVNQPATEYRDFVFQPGDVVTVRAGGCAQTGGHGDTWKHYVYPSGDNAERLYHGRIWIPGATMGLETVASIIRRGPVTVATPPEGYLPSEMFLRLGYDDEDYSDNGYEDHDNGTENQCLNVGNAWVELEVRRNGGSGQARSCPASVPANRWEDLYWSELDVNTLPFNPTFGHQCNGVVDVVDAKTDCAYAWWSGPRIASPSCTSFFPTMDTLDVPFGYCESNTTNVNGHINFGFATYDGTIYWDDYSAGDLGDDDDYNLFLQVPNKTSLTVDNEPNFSPALLLEMAAYETVHQGDTVFPFFPGGVRPGGWLTMAYGSDAEKRALIDGRPAIALGLVGFDAGHADEMHTELHPVLGLAIQTKSPARGDSEEVWLVMVRRSGNEGGCAQDALARTHGFPAASMRFALPTLYKTLTNAYFYNGWTTVSPVWQTLPSGRTILSVPNPPDGQVVLGEIHLAP